MYDDSIAKDNYNPSIDDSSKKNKLLWTSENKSNVTNLGENNGNLETGLFAFNTTVKNSIKYMYLNNNSFSDVNVLKDFPRITELQLQCNSNLSNIDGLSKHEDLSVLTLHNCSLTSIGQFNEGTEEYSGGLTGCSSLSKLSLQNNSSLTSLVGIESAKGLEYLIANNCGITNIDSLKNHSKVSYLDLANNVNLESVKYIQHCKALQYIYLDSNENMDNTEVDVALNGTSEIYGKTVLIKQCINGFQNIPKKYWELFESSATVLDYSLATLGEKLTVDSPKWIKLKDRTDVTKLKLDDQTELPMEDKIDGDVTKYGINSVLSTLTGMKALSLYKCSQVNSIDFAGKMKSLYELDIRSVNPLLTNLSVIDSSTSLNRLIINNSSIDATKIQNLISRFRYEAGTEETCWSDLAGFQCSGLVAENNNFPNFGNCSSIRNFLGGNMGFDVNGNGTLDLCGTGISRFEYRGNCPRKIVLRGQFTSFLFDSGSDVSLSLDGKLSGALTVYHASTKTLDSLANLDVGQCDLTCNSSKDIVLPSSFVNKFRSISLRWNNVVYSGRIDFTKFSESGIVSDLRVYQKPLITGLSNLGNLTNLQVLQMCDCKLSDISWISSLIDLRCLDLSSNNISDISALSHLEKIGLPDEGETLPWSDYLLNGNNITNITPLAEAIGSDGKINYKSLNISNNPIDGHSIVNNVEALLKLHEAGLQKITITGTSFSDNDINELKNGMMIDGVQYDGFGDGNVIK